MGRFKKLFIICMLLMAGVFFSNQNEVQAADAYTVAMSQTTPEGSWVKDTSGKFHYHFQNGSYAKNTWYLINNKIYYFDGNGIMKTGWVSYQAAWYYTTIYGDMVMGKWVHLNNTWYYMHDNGIMLANSWLAKNGSIYFFKSNGAMAENAWILFGNQYFYFKNGGAMVYDSWYQVNNRWYYFQSDGSMYAGGWKQIGSTWYYFQSGGAMVSNAWLKLNGNYYYFYSSGAMASAKWLKENGVYYWFKASGAMAAGQWLWIDGFCYYFYGNGAMAVNTWIGQYYVGGSGRMLTNTYVDGSYVDASGRKQSDASRHLIFVGDSRTVGMSAAVSASNVSFIGKSGQGYTWLTGSGVTSMKNLLASYPNAKVVLCLGVNDLYNISKYVSYYRSLMNTYTQASFFVMSVTPVDEAKEASYGYSVTNAQISTFNAALKANFANCYLDVYSYLKNSGFSTIDGLHYTSGTYQTIYNYVRSQLG